MCINEVKNGAKTIVLSQLALECRARHTQGSLMTRGSQLGQNSIGCCETVLLNRCAFTMYGLWCVCKSLEQCSQSDFKQIKTELDCMSFFPLHCWETPEEEDARTYPPAYIVARDFLYIHKGIQPLLSQITMKKYSRYQWVVHFFLHFVTLQLQTAERFIYVVD